MLSRAACGAGDRGASMIAALAATMVVLGFGAVTLQVVQDDLRNADRRLDRDEPSLHAEYAASEGISRILDGAESSAVASGTVDGEDYGYSITANGDDTWTVVGRSGSGSQERTATAELRRTITVTGDAAEERYAVYAYDEIDVGYITSGDIVGPLGSASEFDFWYGYSVGTRQDYVDICDSCPNPRLDSSYVPITLPTPASPQPCPANGAYELTGPVTLSGHYDCSASGQTLEISGTIAISGPTVIHVGDNTRLDIRNATLNDGGASQDFVIAKPTSSNWADVGVIDDTLMFGRILAPELWLYVGDVTWRGVFEVGTWWLYDWARIDGAYDGPAVSTGASGSLGTSHYVLGTQDLSWTEARDEAAASGGKLVVIDDAAENAFVLATFGDGARSIPIGLSDVATEGSWVTVDGDPAPYLNWTDNEPNNCCGGQDYARIAVFDGTWDDGEDTTNSFIQTLGGGWISTGSFTVIEYEDAVSIITTTEWTIESWQLD
jgi:hypothetical protein